MKRFFITLIFAFLFVSDVAVAAPLQIVATFSILGDMAQTVGGDRVLVRTLIGRGSENHAWQPTPADAKALARAQLVVANGIGFEGWIDRLVDSSGYRGKVVVASLGVLPLQVQGRDDPHAWQNLSNALRYVDNIADALTETDPAGKAVYRANASRYKQEITALDAKIRQMFNAIPQERRKAVTSHNAFAYFSHAYGVEFISPRGIPSSEPSAREIGRIILLIRKEKIPAVFMENGADSRILERIREESGARIGGTLYPDSLSRENGPAASYLEMMRHNAETITRALSGY